MKLVVYPMSDVEHSQQIFYGFDQIAGYKGVDITYRYDGRRHFGVNVTSDLDPLAFLTVVQLQDDRLICFDTHDSAFVAMDLYEKCHMYFKRSYQAQEHAHLDKARPLGPNFHIQSRLPNIGQLRRAMAFKPVKQVLMDTARRIRHPIDDRRFTTLPQASDTPHILFLTRAWDPNESKTPTPEKTRERLSINEMRANCIRALRAEFGDSFIGGFQNTAYGREHFPDVIVDQRQTSKSAYLDTVQRADICVATAGLHRSTGWKFAEYIALGRAVVCEPNCFEPGPGFEAGRNFIEFDSVETCVAVIRALMQDKTRRTAMMYDNLLTYRRFVRPEAMVLSALGQADGAMARRDAAPVVSM